MRGLVLACLLVGVVPAYADNKADQLFRQGRTYLAKKDYTRACKAFAESFELDPAIGTQLNLGLCHKLAGHAVESYRAYAKALALAKAKDDNRFSEIRKLVEQGGRSISHVSIVAPPDAVLVLDDEKVDRDTLLNNVLVMLPGKHTLVVKLATGDRTEHLDLVAGERKELTFRAPEPEPKPPPPPPVTEPAVTTTVAKPTATSHRSTARVVGGTLVLLGGAAVAGYGGYVLFDARSDYRAANCPDQVCATQEAVDAANDAKARARTSTYIICGGVVAIGLGAYLVLTSKRHEQRRVAVMPVVGSHTGGLVIGGSL